MKELRVDVRTVREDQREALAEWLLSLGVNLTDVLPTIAISTGEREYQLHLSRVVRNKDGAMIRDIAADQVVTEPLVIQLGDRKCWPAWIGVAA